MVVVSLGELRPRREAKLLAWTVRAHKICDPIIRFLVPQNQDLRQAPLIHQWRACSNSVLQKGRGFVDSSALAGYDTAATCDRRTPWAHTASFASFEKGSR